MESMLSKLVQLKNSTDGDVREEPPAARGNRGLGAKPPAAGDFVKKKLF